MTGREMQSTVDSLIMMSDMNCLYDLLSATFAKGLRVNDLSLPQVNAIL